MTSVSAPVRLDFAGGWTDVAPYANEAGGVVVNAAIDLRTRVWIEATDGEYHLDAVDLDLQASASDPATFAAGDAGLALHRAVVAGLRPAPCLIRSMSDAPPGSGLGTSGALGVALVGALRSFRGDAIDVHSVAHEAWELETIGAAVAGGKQDQYAAALGGFQQLGFDASGVDVRPIAIDDEVQLYLAAQIVVCHTGRSRFSGTTIARVMERYRNGDADVADALGSMAAIGSEMATALPEGNLTQIGALLAKNWHHQLRLDPSMQTPAMATLEDAMRLAGATGGKAAGSGAGGVIFFTVPGDTRPARDAAIRCGASVLPLRWAAEGLRSEPTTGVPSRPV